MSVEIAKTQSFELLGKFLMLSMSKERALQKIKEYQELNIQNYERRYQEKVERSYYQIDEYSVEYQYIISPEQAYKTLKSLVYNTMDYGEEINPEVFNDIKKTMDKITKKYQLKKEWIELAAWL